MSFGDYEIEKHTSRLDKLVAEADASRAAKAAGYKSPFRYLRERLRPHRRDRPATPRYVRQHSLRPQPVTSAGQSGTAT